MAPPSPVVMPLHQPPDLTGTQPQRIMHPHISDDGMKSSAMPAVRLSHAVVALQVHVETGATGKGAAHVVLEPVEITILSSRT